VEEEIGGVLLRLYSHCYVKRLRREETDERARGGGRGVAKREATGKKTSTRGFNRERASSPSSWRGAESNSAHPLRTLSLPCLL
jgi:hypothetical protein